MNVEFGVRVRIRFRVRRNRIRTLTPNSIDVDLPLAELEGGLESLGNPGALVRSNAHAILDHLEQRLGARVQARIALALQKILDFLLAEVLGDRDREGDDDPRLRSFQQIFKYGRRGIPDDRLAAAAAVQLRGARV